MHWPHITAIVNTHARPHLLPRALNSILAQTYRDFETIVVHDGPAASETLDVVATFKERFDEAGLEFYFADSGECSGYQCVPKNSATSHANGDYIAYLDDDNEWTPNHLEVLVAAIEEGQNWPDFTYGRREYIDERADKSLKLHIGPSPFVPFDEEAKKSLAAGPTYNFIDTSDMLIARGALWRLFLATDQIWNIDLRRFADWELVTRGVFFAGWRGKAVNEIVQRYYWHGGNVQLTRPNTEVPRHIRAGATP